MTRHSWLAARAVIALALMIGFYVLALTLSGILLWIVYAQFAYSERLYPKLILICVAGAATILRSIIPRIDRFRPPGPPVHQNEEPELFDALEAIASGTNQTMPREVYFINEVNAFVAQRGGVMALGAGASWVSGCRSRVCGASRIDSRSRSSCQKLCEAGPGGGGRQCEPQRH